MNNEPAFPINHDSYVEGQCVSTNSWPGLTKREWFAGMALTGICANEEFLKNHKDVKIEQVAFAIADDMISQSQKPQ